ncbi:MAG: MFS transporter [Proteobacteria bacterium]|nr:MFS transporter [Pseudomonadota bacterium]
MDKSKQAASLLSIVFFGFVGLSLPYPIFSPLFLHPDSPFYQSLELTPQWRVLLLGLTLAAYPFAQFFGSPVLGSLSDRYGRKKLLILTMLGTGFGYLLSGLAIATGQVAFLVLSRAITGFFEGNMGIAQACISDLKMDKFFGLGAVMAMASLGYLVGPLVGGFLCDDALIPWFNYETPFYAGCIVALLLALMTALWFQETNLTAPKTTSLWSEFNILKKIKSVYQKPTLRNAFLLTVILSLSVDCYYEFYPAFLVGKWDMTPKSIGLYSVGLSLALSIGALWLPQLLRKRKNPHSFRPPLTVIYVLALLSLLFAIGPISLNLHFFITGLAYSTINTLQAVVISDNANAHEQGEVMGLLWGLRMLGDSLLCVLGSFLLSFAFTWPIIFAVLIGLVATYFTFAHDTFIKEAPTS